MFRFNKLGKIDTNLYASLYTRNASNLEDVWAALYPRVYA